LVGLRPDFWATVRASERGLWERRRFDAVGPMVQAIDQSRKGGRVTSSRLLDDEVRGRGTGTCFRLISLFIALCRAGGIRARHKIFATDMAQAWREAMIDVDPLAKRWHDSLGYFVLEGEGEALVDGQWRVARVGPTAERQAAAGIPITQFGEDALPVRFFARPGTTMRLESLPLGLAQGSRLLHRIAPASMERVDISVREQLERGRRIIERAGGLAAYDAQADWGIE